MDAREAFEKSQSPSRDEIYKKKKAQIIKQFVSRKHLQKQVFDYIEHRAEEGKKESNLADIARSCEHDTMHEIGEALREEGVGIDEQLGFSEGEKDPLTGRRNSYVYYKFSSDENAIIQDISAKILVYAGFDVNRQSGVVSWANPKKITKEQREQQEREQQQEQQQERESSPKPVSKLYRWGIAAIIGSVLPHMDLDHKPPHFALHWSAICVGVGVFLLIMASMK